MDWKVVICNGELMILFGSAGIPRSCKGRSSYEGIQCAKDFGLDAFEFEFVRGCRLRPEKAKECADLARKIGISAFSCHASYFLNLISREQTKYDKSIKELLITARVMDAMGGGKIVFHPGFFMKMPKDEAYEKMKKAFKHLLKEIKNEGLNATLSPEVTGKPTAWGSLEDVYKIAEDLGYDNVQPCIDWAHVHARDNGRIKGRDDYDQILELVEKRVGKEGLKTLQCQMSSINFTEKGERNHMTMDNDIPPYKPLAQALVDWKCKGIIISESPDNEADALYMKKTYLKLLNKK